MTSDELSQRLIDFAARIGKVVDALPDTRMGAMSPGNWFAAGLRPRLITKKRAQLRVGQILRTS